MKAELYDIRVCTHRVATQERFQAADLQGALVQDASLRLPVPIPWPAGKAPVAAPLPTPPAESDDLSRFKGYDAVIVTWTSAEAAALAALCSPGYPTTSWYEYRHNIAAWIPLVTGSRAPFNDSQADMARYYHSLGLYFPCTIGKAKVLLFKSGLQLDYDGPATPVKKLMDEIATAVQPKVFITTGTGGGIGADVSLGDVVIAGKTQFFCNTQFKAQPWAAASYATSPVPAAALAAITPALTQPNAAKVAAAQPIAGRSTPKIWADPVDTIVTTDFFGFDDSTDYYKLQGPGHRACDMGDAMVGQALSAHPNIHWYAIRNASDPQIPNPSHNIHEADTEAGNIYTKYGVFTTAASVIASWAVVDALTNGSGH